MRALRRRGRPRAGGGPGPGRGICAGGRHGACLKPAGHQANETLCDGADNDCGGVIDEGCPCAHTGRAIGACALATRSPEGACAEPDDHEEGAEASCSDGADNDCDGATDCAGSPDCGS